MPTASSVSPTAKHTGNEQLTLTLSPAIDPLDAWRWVPTVEGTALARLGDDDWTKTRDTAADVTSFVLDSPGISWQAGETVALTVTRGRRLRDGDA